MPETPWQHAAGLTGNAYDTKFTALERAGMDMHGEADFVCTLGVASVLDAGCGTGRVAIELARRGLEVAGVDRDPDMLSRARQKAPHVTWYQEDLVDVHLRDAQAPSHRRLFEAVVMAGNVMIFLDPGTEAAVVANLAAHLPPGGLLVAGFQLLRGGLSLRQYDAYTVQAGLELHQRWATWDCKPWTATSDYSVSVHRRPA